MNISLKQGYDMFIFDRETYCKEKTIQNYKNTLSYFFKFMEQDRGCSISEIPLDSVSTMDVKKYVVSLRSKNKLEDHPFKPTVDHPITKRSIKTYSVDVRTFFHFLYDNEYIEKDIMKGFKIIKPEKKLVLPLFQGEVDMIDHLFNQKTYRGLRNYCIVHLMIDEGLRSGDIVNLTTRSVNFDENYVIVLDGKGDKDRIVARIKRETDLKRLKPHLLRHTFATSFILGGGDLESLRLYLGHVSIETTQQYLHLANLYSRMGSDIYKLDGIFFRSYYSRFT